MCTGWYIVLTGTERRRTPSQDAFMSISFSRSKWEEVREIRDEVSDRFGRLPREAENLFRLRELKIIGEKCGAETIRLDPRRVRVKAAPGARLDEGR